MVMAFYKGAPTHINSKNNSSTSSDKKSGNNDSKVNDNFVLEMDSERVENVPVSEKIIRDILAHMFSQNLKGAQEFVRLTNKATKDSIECYSDERGDITVTKWDKKQGNVWKLDISLDDTIAIFLEFFTGKPTPNASPKGSLISGFTPVEYE